MKQTPSRLRAARRALLGAAVLLLIGLSLCFFIAEPFVSPAKLSTKTPSPTSLHDDVVTLTTAFGPRDEVHPENLDKAAEWLKAELQKSAASVTEQSFTLEGQRYKNLIAAFGPETTERIIVSAHYDAAHGLPGADDDASGTAALLELSRLLKDEVLHTRVELVAFSLEETSFKKSALNGSRAYASALKEKGAKVRAMLSLEMLGCYSDEPGSQKFPIAALGLLYPTVGNYLVIVGSPSDVQLVRSVKAGALGAGGIPVRSINAPKSVPGIGWSDHASFWEQGYPAVMVTDTAFFRNPRYHKATDTPDTLDYPRLAEATRAVYGALLFLDR